MDMRSVLFISFLVLILPLASSAQSLSDLTTMSSPFTISVSPQYPAPGSQATLSFLSSSIDLAGATITVSAGGKRIYQGAVKPLAITLGKAGTITNVSVTMSSGGASFSQTISIQPQDVVLVAEPISSAPVLYPGKPSVPIDGDVRVVAIANVRGAGGGRPNPASLSYSWTVDGVQIANSSGIGRVAIIVASPLQYRSRDVSVTVASPDGGLVGGSSLSLSSAEPLVRVYENDPLLGTRFDRAILNSFVILGNEATLYAAPFGLPTTGGVPLLQWFLDGVAAQTGNLITLRPTGSGRGNSSLSLIASASGYSQATVNLSLSFGASLGTNFFGL